MKFDKVIALHNLKVKEDTFYTLIDLLLMFVVSSIFKIFASDENISKYLLMVFYLYSVILVIGTWLRQKNKIYDTFLSIKNKIFLEYLMYYYRLIGILLVILIYLPKNIYNFTILLTFITGYSFFINAKLFGDINMRVILYLYLTAHLPLFLVNLADKFIGDEIVSLIIAICCLILIPYNYKYAIKYTGILNYSK